MCVETKKIYAMATDPIYIGTGGYTIGRVDNTIVRDPITQIPKIPGSSLAGTWRYYMALKLVSSIRELQPSFEDIKKQKGTNLGEKLKNWINNTKSNNGWDKIKKEWLKYHGNVIATIKCAGQDDAPNAELDQVNHSGHCGHCIVCKAFGYSKKDKSWQGMLFFSDLNILFFPVSTRLGVRWITSKQLLNLAGFEVSEEAAENKVIVSKNPSQESYLNLGWLNLEIDKDIKFLDISQIPLKNNIKNLIQDNLILVPDNLISQIINANLEVRTSVSIDPLTGAAKESALFTSEAIPRGTIFYGEIRLMDRSSLGSEDLPSLQSIWQGLKESKDFYKTLGIGGMTTRGFGRMEVYLEEEKKNE
ncbi:RAMP superfamily CRISPR-associated protein [Desulfonauticus submarinus]